jgi:membrane-associated protease RseP (regulator of RpoE activity)
LESWFSQVLSIIAALLLLSLFVMVHELGHYGVADCWGLKFRNSP